MHCRRKGITLAEVILAVGLLGLILVSVIGLFQSLLSSTTKSSDLTTATALAEDRLNELIAQRPIYLSTYGVDFPTQVLQQGVYVHDSADQTTFYTQANPEVLYDDPAVGKTYYLEVEIFWGTADPTARAATRAGQGLQSIKMGRVVYVPKS